VIFLAGLGAGLGVTALQDALEGEHGLVLAARVAQLFPQVIDIQGDNGIPSAADLKPLSTYWEVREQVKQNFVHALDEEEEKQLTYGAVRGMLAALKDPYTRFMAPDEYGDFQSETKGQFDGIGAVLKPELDEKTGAMKIIVLTLIEGGPAADTDLKPGDQIVAVDGESVAKLNIAQVAKRIRGKRGTEVVITVLREGQEEPLDISVTRARVNIPWGEYRMLEGDIGYIWLKQFDRQAEERMRQAVEELQKQGMRGLVLDLTGNHGGLLDMAIKVASIFVGGDSIVWIEERGREARPLPADGEPIGTDLPMVVLISATSASAAEILAGAIQDLDRGTIVGQKSFGKAKVQTVIPLNDGSALAITTANYLTPGKHSVDPDGITPDETIPLPDEVEDPMELHDQQLEAAIGIMERKLATVAGPPSAPAEAGE
jgi:carboxyl-terminal processing protease